MTPLYPAGVYAPLPRFSKKTQTNIAPSAIRMTASARCSRPEVIVSAASMRHLRVCRRPPSLQLEKDVPPGHRVPAAATPGARGTPCPARCRARERPPQRSPAGRNRRLGDRVCGWRQLESTRGHREEGEYENLECSGKS